jgi:cell wall-associated NlpC family hydrolase
MGQNYDVGWCLQFVSDAWAEAGISIHSAYDAADWWNAYRGEFGYAWDTGGARFTTPPRGALVFWGTSKDSPDGHVAISVGNGWLVSTEEGSVNTDAVHLLTINQRNSDGYASSYLGWVMPISGYQIQQ